MKRIVKIGGIFSLIYYGVIVIYSGIHTTFSKFWLVSGGLLTGLSRLPERYLRKLTWPAVVLSSLLGIQTVRMIRSAVSHPDPSSNYMMILGARVKKGGPSKSLERRIDTAAAYLKKHRRLRVIASGGRGSDEPVSEAEAIRRGLIKRGISPERIILEDRSTSTRENMIFSAKIGGKEASYIIVTNGFHMHRALEIAKRIGLLHVSGLSAPSGRILLLNYYIREIFAGIANRIIRQEV